MSVQFVSHVKMDKVRTGSLLCWHGQERIATVVNQAGVWEHQVGNIKLGGVNNMFDENPNTCWHSSENMRDKPKTMRIEFKVSLWSEFRTPKYVFRQFCAVYRHKYFVD